MAVSSPLLLLALASIHFFFLAAADDCNAILTGDVLPAGTRLSTQSATLFVQDNCNLVLYNRGGVRRFSSASRGRDTGCSLTLTDRGQLVVSNPNGGVLWRTAAPNPGLGLTNPGKYAGILRPDGEFAVYGPAVWATPDSGSDAPPPVASDIADQLSVTPRAMNALFSGQSLRENHELASLSYALVMRDDCVLALEKAGAGVVWKAGTAEFGRRCFLRLGNRGQLAVVSGRPFGPLWKSGNLSYNGEYVLLLQTNGQAVVYGPQVWTSATLSPSSFSALSSPPLPS